MNIRFNAVYTPRQEIITIIILTHSKRYLGSRILSIFIHKISQLILDNTKTANGEGTISVNNVKYWETATGSATSSKDDVKNIWNTLWMMNIGFSKGVVKDWSKDLKSIIFNNEQVSNPKIKQQIQIG